MCFSAPTCAQNGTRSQSEAIFVGQVTEVWPSRETIDAHPPRLTLAEVKQLILNRWQGVLSAEEERYIRTTTDKDPLEFRFGIIQRARFTVTEILAGPRIREVYTDVSSCGYRFEPGATYLVKANQMGLRFQTGACSRTSKVESDSAVEDLKALRAWRAGKPLAPRIYGRISPKDLRADTRVRLVDDQGREARLTSPDSSGRFSFDDLAKTKYRFQVEDSRGKGEHLFDLSRIACFEVDAWFSNSWDVGGSPSVVEPKQVPLISEPPPQLVPPIQ